MLYIICDKYIIIYCYIIDNLACLGYYRHKLLEKQKSKTHLTKTKHIIIDLAYGDIDYVGVA